MSFEWRMDEWKDGWMNGQKDRQIDGQTNVQKDRWMDTWIYRSNSYISQVSLAVIISILQIRKVMSRETQVYLTLYTVE